MDRRKFLRSAAAASGIALSRHVSSVSAEKSYDYDVVVIGAGLAGLGAAQTLLNSELSVIVLEAAESKGGRVKVNTSRFGVPYDLGAHWLHHAHANPLLEYAKQHNFTVYPAPRDEVLYVEDREATDQEYRQFSQAYQKVINAIGNAGSQGNDVSPASVVPDVGIWNDLVRLLIGPYEMGKDFDQFSCVDWWNSIDGEDWYCKEGYGAIVAHLAKNVPVQLGTRVNQINWNEPGVTVLTSAGTIRTKSCLVTVSTGVLASNSISFRPSLPVSKQESFSAIPMGLYNHIALQFSDNIFGTPGDSYLMLPPTTATDKYAKGMGILSNSSGSNLTYCDVGGRFAEELEKDGEADCIAFALEQLRNIFGSDTDRSFVSGHTTRWGSDPFTLGSYASASPGEFSKRAILREPVAEKLYFAGEACSKEKWATAHGAYESGINTARIILKNIK